MELSKLLRGLGSLVRLFERRQMSTVRLRLLLGSPCLGLLERGDVGIGPDDARDAAVGHPLDRPTTAKDPHPVPVAVLLAVLEGILFQLAGVLAISFVNDALTIVGMYPRQPGLARRVDRLVDADAAHLAPHGREEGRPVPKVVVPHALPGTFQREVPAALAFRERVLHTFAFGDIPTNSDDTDDFVL